MKNPNRKMKLIRRAKAASLPLLMVLQVSCAGGSGPVFEAEKRLFQAQKMESELTSSTITKRPEFLDRTVAVYRSIVSDFGTQAETVERLERIVVAAQMNVAELETRGGRLAEAQEDFEHAVELARNIPFARMNAMFMSAYLSQQMGNRDGAIDWYERFYDEFLTGTSIDSIAENKTRYLAAPMRLAELHMASDDADAAGKWLDKSEALYKSVMAGTQNARVRKEVNFNLLATHLEQGKWSDATALADDMLTLYTDPSDVSAIHYIRARIYHIGLGDRKKAMELYTKVFEEHPRSIEAPKSLLALAGVLQGDGRLQEAARAYKIVASSYGAVSRLAAQAEWQLAQIEEKRRNWVEASAYYKAIPTKYPTTQHAFEAPLRLAAVYEQIGEKNTIESAYDRARESYRKVLSGEFGAGAKLTAEEYIVRSFIEQKDWKRAIDYLVELPDRYPRYERFRTSYLRAASIYEKELADRQAAVRLLETCTQRYPGSKVAEVAQERIRHLNNRK